MEKVGSGHANKEVSSELALGKRLQEARQQAGLTQQQLCASAGLSYSTLAKIERGAIKSPSIFTIQRIAEALGKSLDALMGLDTASGNNLARGLRKSRSGISFVYFDINGCLVRFFHHAFTKLAEDSGASSDTIESTFWHYNDAACRGEMAMEDFNAALAEAVGIDQVNWSEYYLDAVQPILDMQDTVRWVSEYYPIGLLSNIMPGFIDAMIKRRLIPDLDFKAVVDSSEVMAVKPEQKMYEIATALAGVPATEILLVDDSRPNIMAAERMGWKVLWFDDYQVEDSIERIKSALAF